MLGRLRTCAAICFCREGASVYHGMRWCSTSSAATLIALNAEASKHFANHEFDAAIPIWEKVKAEEESRTPMSSKPSPLLIQVLNNLACAKGEVGLVREKIDLLREALKHTETNYGNDHVQYAVSLYNLGSALGELGEFEEMKVVLENSLALTVKKFGATSAKTARVQLVLAEAYDNLSMHQEQLQTSKEAFEIIERHCGKKHVQTSISRAAYGLALGRCGELPRCISMLQMAMEEQEHLLGPKHPQLSYTLYRLAWAFGCVKQYHRQKEHLLAALDAQKRAFGVNDQRNFDFFIALAETCGNLNQTDEHFDYSKAALKTAEEKAGPTHFKTARACYCCAKLYYGNRSFNLALKFSSRAAEIFSRTFGDDHQETKLARELRDKAQHEVDERSKKQE
jgi:tetratricopeptide (TPR) repeat protein